MTPRQVRLAFRLFFGRELTGAVGDLTDLAAGNIRVVAQLPTSSALRTRQNCGDVDERRVSREAALW